MVVITTGDPVPDMRARRGTYADMVRAAAADAHGGPSIDIDAREREPSLPAEPSFVVITGSSAHVPDRDAWVVRLEAWLSQIVAAGVPTFGICFGHQLLAQALGGEVSQNPRGREIGSIDVDLVGEDPILEGVEPRFRANATHTDTVSKLPADARALARSSHDDHQVIRFASHCYGVQFHPEIDLEIMRGYFDARRPLLEAEGLDVDARKAAASEAPGAIRVLQNFIRLVAI